VALVSEDKMACFKGVRWVSVAFASIAYFALSSLAASDRLRVQISVGDNNMLKGAIDGRVVLMFAPNGTDPLEDTDVTSTPNKMFGKNVFSFSARDRVVMSGGSPNNTATGVSGFPLVSIGKLSSTRYPFLFMRGCSLAPDSTSLCFRHP
jgi:hypothetical protein